MALNTVAINFHNGYIMPYCIRNNLINVDDKDWSNMYKSIFIEKGIIDAIVNGNKIIFHGPSILCLSEKDEFSIINTNNLEVKVLYFHPSVINNRLNFNILHKPLQSIMSTSDFQDVFYLKPFINNYTAANITYFEIDSTQLNYCLNFLNAIENELNLQSTRQWPCKSRTLLIQLLFTLLTILERKQQLLHDTSTVIDDLLFFIHNHYDESLTLDFLCQKFNSNRTTLSEKFKEKTGYTIMDYIINLRLKLAKMMLNDTELNISEISYRLGFTDPTYFSRVFKSKTGRTPSQFRKNSK